MLSCTWVLRTFSRSVSRDVDLAIAIRTVLRAFDIAFSFAGVTGVPMLLLLRGLVVGCMLGVLLRSAS